MSRCATSVKTNPAMSTGSRIIAMQTSTRTATQAAMPMAKARRARVISNPFGSTTHRTQPSATSVVLPVHHGSPYQDLWVDHDEQRSAKRPVKQDSRGGAVDAAGASSEGELREELLYLRKRQGLADRGRLRGRPLPRLRQIATTIRHRKAEDDLDPLRDVYDVLVETIQEQRGQSLTILAGEFALSSQVVGEDLNDRRRSLAALLAADVKTIARRGDSLLWSLTYRLLERSTESRLRVAHGHMEAGQPVDGALAVDWLDRFEHYYRMWTPLSGLRNDINAALEWGATRPDRPLPAQYRTGPLYYYASFLLELRRFEQDRGGLWLLADAEDEIAVADLAYHVTWHMPVSDDHASWLRRLLAQQPGREQHPFTAGLTTEPVGRTLLARLDRWLGRCACGSGPDSEHCEVHELLADADTFIQLIDRNWYRIADWYRLAPARLGSQGDLRGDLGRRYEADLHQLDIPPATDGRDVQG